MPRTRTAGAPALMTLLLLPCLAGVMACRAGAGAPAGTTPAVPNAFAADPLWDDGRAEIDAYEASEPRYGIPRPLTAYHIVVKEDFSRSQLVKVDPGHDPSDRITVLKLNQVLHLQTGIYAYHQMASAFFERSGMELLKLSVVSFEWCGNSYKEYTRRGDGATLRAHTYWDGQADVTYPLPTGADVILYDQLPLWVRSLPQVAGTTRRLRLVPGQIGSQAPPPRPTPVTLRAVTEEPVATPAGRFQALRWELQPADGSPDLYWTARQPPYLLVAWDKADGGRYRLLWTQRLAYWRLNHPGDERHLQGPEAP
jgi:hypothetical protein